MGRNELENLVRMALEVASERGVDQAEAVTSVDTGLAATARLGDVENLEYTNDRGLWITVFKDSRKGNASTSDVSPEAIREAVDKACTFAECTAQDEYAGLADAELMCTEVPDLELDHPWSIEASDAIDMAVALLQDEMPETTTEYGNGMVNVPAKQTEVIAVNRENLVAVLIESGYYTSSDFSGLE